MRSPDDPDGGVICIDVFEEEIVMVTTVDEHGNVTRFFFLRSRSQVTWTNADVEDDLIVDIGETEDDGD